MKSNGLNWLLFAVSFHSYLESKEKNIEKLFQNQNFHMCSSEIFYKKKDDIMVALLFLSAKAFEVERLKYLLLEDEYLQRITKSTFPHFISMKNVVPSIQLKTGI